MVDASQIHIMWEHDLAGDYYEGRSAGLYVDGKLVWDGTSCDALGEILSAIFGTEDFAYSTAPKREPGKYSTRFPEQLPIATGAIDTTASEAGPPRCTHPRCGRVIQPTPYGWAHADDGTYTHAATPQPELPAEAP